MKKYITTLILIVLGAVLFTYGFFSFILLIAAGVSERFSFILSRTVYNSDTLKGFYSSLLHWSVILPTIGAGLIVLGLLLRKREKSED